MFLIYSVSCWFLTARSLNTEVLKPRGGGGAMNIDVIKIHLVKRQLERK